MTESAQLPAKAGDRARPPAVAQSNGRALERRLLSPIEKAAILLTAIGPELGGGFLKGLSETDLMRFAQALSGLGRVQQEELDEVIVEFLEALTAGPEVAGDAEAARKLLSAVLDEDEIARLFDAGRGSQRSVWERLNEAPVAALSTFLAAEHPQTAAVILSEMRPEAAANALERLDRNFAQMVVLRLSRVPSLDMPISQAIQAAIDRDFLSVLQRNMSKRRPAELIASLMNNISSEARDGFLGYLEGQDAVLAADVQRTMFTFEDIPLRVNPRELSTVLREVAEDVLMPAMKLAKMMGSPALPFILENVPRRLSERYAEDLNAMPDVPRKEGEAAQIEITKTIQQLARSGAIRLVEKDPAA